MRNISPAWAPSSTLPTERRGGVVGRFCRECSNFYPLYAARHKGKPTFGRDHVSAPCSCEGRAFEAAAGWWEPAVVVLAAPPAQPTPPAPPTTKP